MKLEYRTSLRSIADNPKIPKATSKWLNRRQICSEDEVGVPYQLEISH